MRLPEAKILVGHLFIELLVQDHGLTLTQISFVDCGISMESVGYICGLCPSLERLELPIPLKDLVSEIPEAYEQKSVAHNRSQIAFTSAVGRSNTLRTIVNSTIHTDHGHHQALDARNVKYLMSHVRKLDKIVSDKRIWTVSHCMPGLTMSMFFFFISDFLSSLSS